MQTNPEENLWEIARVEELEAKVAPRLRG